MMGFMTMIRHIAATLILFLAFAEGAAAADCFSIGQSIARERGGELVRAVPSSRNGQPVCEIVVLVPGRDGERPRREQVTVPQG
ncbi:hypothetical protein [Limoniibacter endophyticus]|uniref:Uncharacterized protein n=1 Tax=Limoniibacter endophyticus TaxID=1565040 RepID=A0A8J3DGJ2_9HYPH|nr:hypothetical protein [Limoniibacter endophyticus]GHC69278.1 hypothetical protein GCM10010136_14930 [Limoniibacter endophyticus]